ncbi:lamin tail domain-containing protein [Streptomyces sp. NPDC048332]|uniref:lamin tail domain-containing protein n=1 Tax=unclassified Streptomyces TaxID=2593676 RepID=UPI00341B8F2C
MTLSASSATRRIAATVLTAGAVVSAVALPASAHDRDNDRHRPQARVVISDVQADSPGRDNGSNRSLNREWIEITNQGRRAVDLDGWTLRGDNGNRYRFDDVRLGGYATVRIHTGVGRDTRTDLYQDRYHYVWDNYSDTATLRDDRGRTVDKESWGRGHHHRR